MQSCMYPNSAAVVLLCPHAALHQPNIVSLYDPRATAAEATVVELRKEYTAVDAEELAEESSDDGGSQSDGPTSPHAAERRRPQTQSFGGFNAVTTVAAFEEDLSPEGFGGDAVSHLLPWFGHHMARRSLKDPLYLTQQSVQPCHQARVWSLGYAVCCQLRSALGFCLLAIHSLEHSAVCIDKQRRTLDGANFTSTPKMTP